VPGQLGGQQFGVPQSDGDGGLELVRGILEERALVSQQLAGLVAGPVASGRCGPAAVSVPDDPLNSVTQSSDVI
jgi:hypothetical protein